jgi:hypothetical protein
LLAKLRPRSAYDVMAALALFVAISTGGAYAANTVFSTDIVDGEVKTADLANAGVTNGKLAPNAVTTGKVADNNITATDIANTGNLGPAEIGGLGSADIADNSLTGADINENSLATVTSSVLGGLGRAGLRQNGQPGPGSCDPESEAYVNCDMVAKLDLTRPARVLVIGSVRAMLDSDGSSIGAGRCRLGTTLGPIPGTDSATNLQSTETDEFMTIAGVTGVFPAGPQHGFGIDCNEIQSVQYLNSMVTAVALSDR